MQFYLVYTKYIYQYIHMNYEKWMNEYWFIYKYIMVQENVNQSTSLSPSQYIILNNISTLTV